MRVAVSYWHAELRQRWGWRTDRMWFRCRVLHWHFTACVWPSEEFHSTLAICFTSGSAPGTDPDGFFLSPGCCVSLFRRVVFANFGQAERTYSRKRSNPEVVDRVQLQLSARMCEWSLVTAFTQVFFFFRFSNNNRQWWLFALILRNYDDRSNE